MEDYKRGGRDTAAVTRGNNLKLFKVSRERERERVSRCKVTDTEGKKATRFLSEDFWIGLDFWIFGT